MTPWPLPFKSASKPHGDEEPAATTRVHALPPPSLPRSSNLPPQLAAIPVPLLAYLCLCVLCFFFFPASKSRGHEAPVTTKRVCALPPPSTLLSNSASQPRGIRAPACVPARAPVSLAFSVLTPSSVSVFRTLWGVFPVALVLPR